jgi:hypothetical protein
VARRLAGLDAHAPTPAEIVANEKQFSRRISGPVVIVVRGIQRLFGADPLVPVINKFNQRFAAQELRRRKLILRAAARAFVLEQGRPPANATELVPDYLVEAPLDPASGAILAIPRETK